MRSLLEIRWSRVQLRRLTTKAKVKKKVKTMRKMPTSNKWCTIKCSKKTTSSKKTVTSRWKIRMISQISTKTTMISKMMTRKTRASKAWSSRSKLSLKTKMKIRTKRRWKSLKGSRKVMTPRNLMRMASWLISMMTTKTVRCLRLTRTSCTRLLSNISNKWLVSRRNQSTTRTVSPFSLTNRSTRQL